MKDARLEQIVNTVLYEGHILYPYRASSKKNQHGRFTFGRVYPDAFANFHEGAEPGAAQTECLLNVSSETAILNASLGFLQPMARKIGVLPKPVLHLHKVEENWRIVPELRVNGELFQTWMEATERHVQIPLLKLYQTQDISSTHLTPFSFPKSFGLEPIYNERGEVLGAILREQEAISGRIITTVQRLRAEIFKVTVRVENKTELLEQQFEDNEAVLQRTFASTHMVLRVLCGSFISLMDPGIEHRADAETCCNIGLWPVLAGEKEKQQQDVMLASPIILYDYPEIAPESAGPLCDATEIDEILTLRILTLTEEEKLEARSTDSFARRLLERTEALKADDLFRLHGRMRNNPDRISTQFNESHGADTANENVQVAGVILSVGDRVRIRTKANADVMDIALNGQTAVIEAVERDMENRVHLAVVLENDPGKDLGLMRQPGHRFFFGIDEVEPLSREPV